MANIVTVKKVPLFRRSTMEGHIPLGLDVSDIYDDVLLICPDELSNPNPIKLDLDGPVQQEVVHIVRGDDGSARVEPYWVSQDKFPLCSWEMFKPGPVMVNIGTLKTPPDSMYFRNDIFLPLWDNLSCKSEDQMTDFERLWCSTLAKYPSPHVKQSYLRWSQRLRLPKDELDDNKRSTLELMQRPRATLSEDEKKDLDTYMLAISLIPEIN